MRLKQVIASILTDLTQAQSASDAYSRKIKAAYKEDSSLRLLSVPKAEIKEIKLDLKLAFLKANRVVIYQHPDYQGSSQELREGSYDLGSLTMGNNVLSSLKVSDGMKVTLYEEENFKGTERSFIEDTPNMTTYNFDNKTSSIKVERVSTDKPMDDLRELNVEIFTDQLKQLPESALSSISITLDLSSI